MQGTTLALGTGVWLVIAYAVATWVMKRLPRDEQEGDDSPAHTWARKDFP